jgi:exodeoxyribonuclease VII small subunit
LSAKEKLPEDAPLEKVVERLEGIVEELESGKADLEKSIELYREGKSLGDRALKRLDALERRIQLVVHADGETLETEEFPPQNLT